MDEKVEAIAKALFEHRYEGDWKEFCEEHEDIAEIYRENARVALKVIDEWYEKEGA